MRAETLLYRKYDLYAFPVQRHMFYAGMAGSTCEPNGNDTKNFQPTS